MKTLVAPLALIVSAFSPALGQTLQGTWKPVEVVIDSGPDHGRHTTDVQPGLLIFTKGHYSMMFVMGFTPRPLPADSATKEQIGLLFLPYGQRWHVSAQGFDDHLLPECRQASSRDGGTAIHYGSAG